MHFRYKKQVASFMKRLYECKLTTCFGGNISYKNNDYIYITPSAIDKGNIKPSQIIILTIGGVNLTPKLKPSIESEMHLAIYEKRPDINSIVHAHPVYSTSFTAMNMDINYSLIAESRAILGIPENADYALMGTTALAEIVSNATLKSNVVLMANHGVLTLGNSLLQAFDRIEVLESAARMTIITESMNSVKELTKDKLMEIDNLMKTN